MALRSQNSRIVLFFVVGFGLALLMAGLKAAIAWAAATYLYSAPWVGGFLRSIELLEVSNLLVFAILGAGVGVATVLLPRRWPHSAKLAFLLVLSPIVFSASYMMMQHLWIKQVAANASIPYREARDVTNTYLQREGGSGGFFGFFPFSTQLSELPTRLDVLRSESSSNPNELLSEELSSYNDPRADLAAYIFERVGWLIRLMYVTIAALTGLIYYFKGHSWVENRAQANAGPTTVPPRAIVRKKKKSSSASPKAPTPRRAGSPGNSSRKSTSKSSGKSAGKSAGDTARKSPRIPISKPDPNSPPSMPQSGSTAAPSIYPTADYPAVGRDSEALPKEERTQPNNSPKDELKDES